MKRLKINVAGKSYDVEVELLEEADNTSAPKRTNSGSSRVSTPVAQAKAPQKMPTSSGDSGGITSPLAALVVSVDVTIGDSVEAGQTLITLEAMKMNTIVAAPNAGTVKAIHVKNGDGVEEGQSLIEVQ